MSTQAHVSCLEPVINIVLSEQVQRGLDQQIENFMATWMPKIHDYNQFRYIFDGLMCLGQTSSAQTEQISQDVLARKLKHHNHSKNLEEILVLFKQFQQLLQVNNPAQKTRLQGFKKPPPTQSISLGELCTAKAVMCNLIHQIDAQHTSLSKDNLYLEYEHHALITATEQNEQYLYIAEKLNHVLVLWQQQASDQIMGLSENLTSCQQYLQAKQHAAQSTPF